MNSDAFIEEELASRHLDGRLAMRLLAFVKPYWKHVVLSSAVSLLMALLHLAGPYIVKVTIDQHIARADFHGIAIMSALFVATVIGIFLMEYIQALLIA